METISLRTLGRIADAQICPRRRYWRWEHLGPGIEPYRPGWKQVTEQILATQIANVLRGETDPDPIATCSAALATLAATPGIRDLNPINPASDAAEIGRLAGALLLSWSRRRLPVLERSSSQPATMVVKVTDRNITNERPDSRLFDLLIEEDSILLETFVTGMRWNGWRFNNPLLYYWKTLKDAEILYDRPEAKAMCFEPPYELAWIERLEKMEGDPIGRVIKGGSVVTLPEGQNKITLAAYQAGVPGLPHQYFHSCGPCEYKDICFGPEPFPKDATEAYPGIYKRREPVEQTKI